MRYRLFLGGLLVLFAFTQAFSQSNFVPIGASPNPYAVLLDIQHPLAYQPDLDALAMVHRSALPGTSSGVLVLDRSLDGGLTWINDQIVTPAFDAGLVPGVIGNRYPSCTFYTPPGNTDPARALVSVSASGLTSTSGITWGLLGKHTIRFGDLSVSQEVYTTTQPGLPIDFLPSSPVTNTATGELWSISGTFAFGSPIPNYRFVNLNRGVADTITGRIEWMLGDTMFTPDYRTSIQLGESAPVATPVWTIAFSPDGQTGYAVILAGLTSSITPSMQPVLWKTTDAGDTWHQLPAADLAVFPALQARLKPADDGRRIPYWLSVDGVVDQNGKLHLFSRVTSRTEGDPDQLTNVHAGLGDAQLVHQIVSDGTDWDIRLLGSVRTNAVGLPVVGNLAHDVRTTMTRSQDGSKVFFLWNSSDPVSSPNNGSPNLIIRGYDVLGNRYTESRSPTVGTAYEGLAFWPHSAPVTRERSGATVEYELPITFLLPGATELDPVQHVYLGGAGFSSTDFNTVPCLPEASPLAGSSTVTPAEVQLDWNATPGAEACAVKLKQVPSGPTRLIKQMGIEPASLVFPTSFLNPGSIFTWRVRCACFDNPPLRDFSFWTPFVDTFSIPLVRTAASLPGAGMSVSVQDGTAWMRFHARVSGPHKVEWFDFSGRVLGTDNADLSIGQDWTDGLGLSGLAAGTYLVVVSSAEGRETKRFTITR